MQHLFYLGTRFFKTINLRQVGGVLTRNPAHTVALGMLVVFSTDKGHLYAGGQNEAFRLTIYSFRPPCSAVNMT